MSTHVSERKVEGVQLIGVSPEVLQDPRVQEALHKADTGDELSAAKAVVGDPLRGLARYGIKLRPLSLAVVGPMLVQVENFKPSFRKEYHMTALLFMLGAPLEQVYEALEAGEDRGTAAFMALASEWVQTSGIPHEISAEVTTAISETFDMVGRMMGSMSADTGGEAKKKRRANPGS